GGAGKETHDAAAFGDRIGRDVGLADDGGFRAVGQRGHERAALQVERPAVIAATERAAKFLPPERDGNAAMRTAVFERVYRSAFAQQHDLLVEERERARLAASQRAARDDRIPVVGDAAHRAVVERETRRARPGSADLALYSHDRTYA